MSKKNPAEARDMMKNLEEIDPVWAQKVQEYGTNAKAKVLRFIGGQLHGNALW